MYFKWNPFNLINKGYVRNTDDMFENVSDREKPRQEDRLISAALQKAIFGRREPRRVTPVQLL